MKNNNIDHIVRPDWIRARAVDCSDAERIKTMTKELGLHTVCEEALCPNKGYCWSKKHVTFIVLGDICTRKCKFCNIASRKAGSPDILEPKNIARAVRELSIKYAVITSVTRDDIEDGGGEHFCSTVREIEALNPGTIIELLIPDLKGEKNILEKVVFSGANVIGHNLETVRALYPDIRPQADYKRSIAVLKMLNGFRKEGADIFVKSSIMLGLGETGDEIYKTLNDIAAVGVDIMYIGQYLSPSGDHWPVKKYYSPEEFDEIREEAYKIGFKVVQAGPMVRSSYKAYEAYIEAKKVYSL